MQQVILAGLLRLSSLKRTRLLLNRTLAGHLPLPSRHMGRGLPSIDAQRQRAVLRHASIRGSAFASLAPFPLRQAAGSVPAGNASRDRWSRNSGVLGQYGARVGTSCFCRFQDGPGVRRGLAQRRGAQVPDASGRNTPGRQQPEKAHGASSRRPLLRLSVTSSDWGYRYPGLT
jgi:hypothetical protein